ncbi:MAG: cyclodeaminase/cyclohydrolase family protein [Candidatus Tantalella remota]|nr:cyclodeaminase/cyclohydrolase family protein [Candidatus Tantalella remota]
MSDHINNGIGEYIEALSAKSTTPGGGSVSALAAALGAGLNLMVIRYSMKEGATPAGFCDLLALQEKIAEKLKSLVDEDCRVFTELMEALSSKKDVQQKFVQAATVPLEVCRVCGESIKVTESIVEEANRNLISDSGCAAHMIKAAFLSAKLNVEVNLKHIDDGAFVSGAVRELDDIGALIEAAAARVEKFMEEGGRNG